MFEGLKKKFSSFIDSLSKKEEEKPLEPEQQQAASINVAQAPINIKNNEEKIQAHQSEKHAIQDKKDGTEPSQKSEVRTVSNAPKAKVEEPVSVKVTAPSMAHEDVQAASQPKEQHQGAKISAAHDRRASEPQVSTFTKIKGMFLGHVKISEKDADPFIESLKMGLLQSDVNYDVTERITDNIRRNLVGREVSSRNISADIRDGIRESILGVLSSRSKIQIIDKVKEKAAAGQLPYRILFVGPNGAGKTTTMAKVASMLLSNGISCVLSASDTFRAAAIEQTAYHAGKLGINVIKGTYGADPASVAFDAIAHAKAHNIMVVLIDSAGYAI